MNDKQTANNDSIEINDNSEKEVKNYDVKLEVESIPDSEDDKQDEDEVMSPPAKKPKRSDEPYSWFNDLSLEERLRLKVDRLEEELDKEKQITHLQQKEIVHLNSIIRIETLRHGLIVRKNKVDLAIDEIEDAENRMANNRKEIDDACKENAGKTRAEQIQAMGKLLATQAKRMSDGYIKSESVPDTFFKSTRESVPEPFFKSTPYKPGPQNKQFLFGRPSQIREYDPSKQNDQYLFGQSSQARNQ